MFVCVRTERKSRAQAQQDRLISEQPWEGSLWHYRPDQQLSYRLRGLQRVMGIKKGGAMDRKTHYETFRGESSVQRSCSYLPRTEFEDIQDAACCLSRAGLNNDWELQDVAGLTLRLLGLIDPWVYLRSRYKSFAGRRDLEWSLLRPGWGWLDFFSLSVLK